MSPNPTRSSDLTAVPERPALTILDAVLGVAKKSLREQHLRIDDATLPLSRSHPMLLGARLLITRIEELQQLIQFYDHTVGEQLDDQSPF